MARWMERLIIFILRAWRRLRRRELSYSLLFDTSNLFTAGHHTYNIKGT